MQEVQNTVNLSVNLQALLRKEDDVWVAWCPAIDVASQGDSQEQAFGALEEAIGLWFEDCLERGVLPAALKEVGFQPVSRAIEVDGNMISIQEFAESSQEEVGNRLIERDLHVRVPAYVAAAMLSEANHATH